MSEIRTPLETRFKKSFDHGFVSFTLAAKQSGPAGTIAVNANKTAVAHADKMHTPFILPPAALELPDALKR